jgi:toxin-antitoxin system PIN domain toxin
MTSFFFPDINVWIALNYDQHVHHAIANRWYQALPVETRLVFCRQTQLGLFRILTTPAVMGAASLTQLACWQLYDRWLATGQLLWCEEPPLIEGPLRAQTSSKFASPKAWMDAYLATFAEAAGLTLVTFDQALAGKAKGAVLLR